MKSGDAYKFTLSWPMDTEEQILAGEYLGKLGNKKSKFIIQLICDYISATPEAINSEETLKFILNSTPIKETMTEMIKSIIKTELAGKMVLQQSSDNSNIEQLNVDIDIDDMFENLEIWNNT